MENMVGFDGVNFEINTDPLKRKIFILRGKGKKKINVKTMVISLENRTKEDICNYFSSVSKNDISDIEKFYTDEKTIGHVLVIASLLLPDNMAYSRIGSIGTVLTRDNLLVAAEKYSQF
jgi:hypothetical protein